MNLSVNLNKVALLRNSRGGRNPGLLQAAAVCVSEGARGLTLHWREDNRHTQKHDVYAVRAYAEEQGVEFNLEGDPRKELLELALEIKPTQFTLVPVTPGEITSDHGWDLPQDVEKIRPILAPMNDAGIRTAIFVDPIPQQMEAASQTETQRIEIYTEPYAAAYGTSLEKQAFVALRDCARAATGLGMGVNAGHDLNLRNTLKLACEVPELLEVSIGHALICDALYMGFAAAVRAYVAVTQKQVPEQIPETYSHCA